jgi:uncharacterized membrane protein YtjA (UPF0391 family)
VSGTFYLGLAPIALNLKESLSGPEAASIPAKGVFHMLYWALMFLVIALIAAFLGFTGVAILAGGVAKILFFIFIVLFVVSLIAHLARRA